MKKVIKELFIILALISITLGLPSLLLYVLTRK